MGRGRARGEGSVRSRDGLPWTRVEEERKQAPPHEDGVRSCSGFGAGPSHPRRKEGRPAPRDCRRRCRTRWEAAALRALCPSGAEAPWSYLAREGEAPIPDTRTEASDILTADFSIPKKPF